MQKSVCTICLWLIEPRARFPRLAASPTPRLPRLPSQRERPATRDGPRVPMNVLEIAAAHSIPVTFPMKMCLTVFEMSGRCETY